LIYRLHNFITAEDGLKSPEPGRLLQEEAFPQFTLQGFFLKVNGSTAVTGGEVCLAGVSRMFGDTDIDNGKRPTSKFGLTGAAPSVSEMTVVGESGPGVM
jgi:hypothetical protein